MIDRSRNLIPDGNGDVTRGRSLCHEDRRRNGRYFDAVDFEPINGVPRRTRCARAVCIISNLRNGASHGRLEGVFRRDDACLCVEWIEVSLFSCTAAI